MGQNVGPILAALGAGAASAYSPYAARGIGVGANVLGEFAQNKYRQVQGQRVQAALAQEAEERQRQEQIRTQTDNLIDENTEYGPPFNPPPGGIGTGIPLQQARLAKLMNAQNTGEALKLLETRLGQAPAQPLTAIQGIKLGQGERLKAKTAEGFDYERDVPKPEARKLRFDVWTDPRGVRRQKVTDENTGDVVKENLLGRERVPNETSIQAFTDDSGNRVVTGVGPGGGVVFQRVLGKTAKESTFSYGKFRKDLALRSRGRNVADPEVQALDPPAAGQTLHDLSGSNLLEMLLGGEEGGGGIGGVPAPRERSTQKLTPQEEADRYLRGR